jgi:hypothetical protein
MRLRSFITVAVLIAAALLACNSITGIGNLTFTSSDGGGLADGGGAADAGGTPVADGAVPWGVVPPSGNHLVTSPNIELRGMTSDGYVAYGDKATGILSVVQVEQADGGPSQSSIPTRLGPAELSTVYAYGRVVLFFAPNTEVDAGPSRTGTLSVWSPAFPARVVAATPALVPVSYYPYAASADGHYLLFLGNVAPDGATASIILADLEAASTRTLVSSVDILTGDCAPTLGFSGGYALASFCQVAPGVALDAGTSPLATVGSFDIAADAGTTLATDVYSGFGFDSNGVAAVMVGANGLVASPVSGTGGLVTIDPAGVSGDLSNDGQLVVYTTKANALWRASTSAPVNATQLVPSGFSNVDALSSDQSWVVGHLKEGTNGATDLFAASAQTAATTAMTLSATPTASATSAGDSFTIDSSYALYLTGYTANFTGSLYAYPLATRGPAVFVGNGASEAYGTQNSQLVFNANAANGQADLEWIDLAVPGSFTVIVSHAGEGFLLGPAKDQIVYTFTGSAGGSLDGLWVVPVPGGTQIVNCAGAGGPIAVHPSGPAKSCTASEVAALDAACFADNASGCSGASSSISSACYACLYSPVTATQWGVVLDNPAGGGLFQLNASACFANQGVAACGGPLQALRECENNVCAGETSKAAFETCRAKADQATCACYTANLNIGCASVTTSPCIVPASDSFEQAFLALAQATCE